MYIETTADELLRGLRAVAGCVGETWVSPVLGCVLIQADADGARISATDQDIHLTVNFATSAHSGAARLCVPLRPLRRLVGAMPADATLRISHDGKAGADWGGVEVSFAGGSYRLAALSPADFPAADALGGGEGDPVFVAVPPAEFGEALRFVEPCISREETRYYLNGVCLDDTHAVATDGHQMAVAPSGLTLPDGMRPILPHPLVALLRRLGGLELIKICGLRMRVRFAGGVLTARLIDGTFPDWRRVNPPVWGASGRQCRLTLDRAALMAALQRLGAVQLDEGGPMVLLAASAVSSRLALRARSVGAEGGREVLAGSMVELTSAARAAAPLVATLVNRSYLAGLARGLRGAERIEIVTRTEADCLTEAPIRITEAGGAGERWVVLAPMRHGMDLADVKALLTWADEVTQDAAGEAAA